MQSIVALLAAVAVLTSMIGLSNTCSCRPSHPQKHYCEADFVILARVKREFTYDNNRVYKIQIRKEYKMSEKATEALKSGRLLTATEGSLCGVQLKVGKVYAIAGKIKSLKAYVNLCNMHELWRNLSKRQRRGLKRMYRQGCTCDIKICSPRGCPKKKDACNWTTMNFNLQKDCQRREGICLRSMSKQCTWTRNAALTACMKNETLTKVNLPSLGDPDKMFGL